MLGYGRSKELPHFYELVHPDERAGLEKLFREQLSDRSIVNGERIHTPGDYRLRCADGSYTWMHAEAISVTGDDGRTLRYVCSFTDISERKRQEEALATERQRLALVVRATEVGILDWEAATNVFWYSERYKELLGYPRDFDTSGWTNFFDGIHPEDRERCYAFFIAGIRRGEPNGVSVHELMEFRLRRADGSHVWVQAQGLTVRDAAGRASRYLAACTDISARRAQQEQLQDQVALTKAIVERIPNAVFVKDAEGRYLLLNRGWSDMSGIPVEQALGRTVYQMYPQETAERFSREDDALLAGGASAQPTEAVHQGPRNMDQYRIVRKAVLAREDGKVLGLVGVSTDISEMKRIEGVLSNQVKFTEDLLESVPLALAMRDPDGRYLFVNRTWERYYGARREQVIGTRPHDRMDRADADQLLHLDRASLEAGRGAASIFEDRVWRGRHYIQTRTVMVDRQGKTLGVLIASLDTTERYAMQQALATEQRRLALVVRAAQAGILDWDGVSRSGYYSPRLREIMGHPPDADTSGWPDYFDLVHELDRERVRGAFRRHIMGTGAAGKEEFHEPITYRLRRADGSHVWVQGMGVSVRDRKGYATRFIASITDITEQRAQEEALRENVRLREEVERISRHDIKTPLHSILAVPRILRERRNLSREENDLLTLIERAGYRILNMVNQSLDLFKIEEGTYQIHAQAVNIADLLAKVIGDVGTQASSRQVAMRVVRDGVASDLGDPAWAWGEELLCYSVFANLLKNAVEASPANSVVSIDIEPGEQSVLVRIHNVGAVPEAIRSRFFQKYITAGKPQGTGLGTYSALLMARVQSGDVAMETGETGTMLTVRLPVPPAGTLPAADAGPDEVAALPELPHLRVLVADDDEYNRIVLDRYLPAPPLEVEMAVNGKAAVEAARARRPDVILMDLDMPVMNGYDAVTQVRAHERENGTLPSVIIAFTSHDDDATRRRSREAGCDHFVTKPVSKDALLGFLSELARPGAAPAAPETHTRQAAVDDEVVVDPDLRASLPGFLDTRRGVVEQMARAVDAGDRVTLRKLAHLLKGSLSLYGFAWASEHARQIQLAAEAADRDVLLGAVDALRNHLETAKIRFGT